MSLENYPDYLNEELLVKALGSNFEDFEKINNFQVSLASGNGENYTSTIYKVLVDFNTKQENRTISLMVKCLNDSDNFLAVTDEYGLFVKELGMYTDVGPKIENLIGEKWFPKCFYTSPGKTNIFVLENMKFSNYDTLDRLKGLDFNHCKLVVEKLAKVHAASMVLAEENPDVFRDFSFGVIEGKTGSMTKGYFTPSITFLIKVVKTWEGYEEIAEKLEIIKLNPEKYFMETMKKTVPKFKCLNHGDLWTNNILFKHDKSGCPVDLVFIDFQMTFFSSVGIDWNYFLHTSPTDEVRENRLKDLLKIYHEVLCDTLRNLNYDSSKIPTLEDIENEIRRFEFFAVFCTTNMLPLIIMDRSENIACNFESLKDNDPEFRRVQFEGALYQKRMKAFLKSFDANGTLDFP